MRNRILEVLAALVGVAIVVAIYLDRSDSTESTAPVVQAPAAIEQLPADQTGSFPPPAPPPAPTYAPVSAGEATSLLETAPVVEEEVIAATVVWEAARADLEQVETELGWLDSRFDAKEAEFAELESGGMDAQAIEEQMLIFLDGMVDEYDELETRLAEAEAAESAAAERLSELRGELPALREPEG